MTLGRPCCVLFVSIRVLYCERETQISIWPYKKKVVTATYTQHSHTGEQQEETIRNGHVIKDA
jgi:hypothetical protein